MEYSEKYPLSYRNDEYANELARNLNTLTPAEVLALDNHLVELAGGGRALEKSVKLLHVNIGHAIDLLPQQDVEFARRVYVAYAESVDPNNRETAALKILYLTQADHDYGLNLWDRLIRDEDSQVRYYAHEPLSAHGRAVAGRNYELADAELTKLGISWREARQLLDAYADAERGERVFKLGEVALQRLLEATSEQSE